MYKGLVPLATFFPLALMRMPHDCQLYIPWWVLGLNSHRGGWGGVLAAQLCGSPATPPRGIQASERSVSGILELSPDIPLLIS